MGRGGGRSGGGGSSHGGSRGVTSGRGGSSRSSSSGMRSASSSSRSSSSTHRGGAGFGGPGARSSSKTHGTSSASYHDSRYDRAPRVPLRAGWGGWRRRSPYYGGYGPAGAGSSGGCLGCLSSLVMLVVALVAAIALMPATCASGLFSGGGGTSSGSTRVREKLASSLCTPSDEWLSDRAEWLDDKDKVIEALRYFYNKTGSQPYLVVATNIDGRTDFTDDEGDAWANALYDEKFDDEGHTVVAFVEYEESRYAYYIVAGSDAQEVIDDEARGIIADNIDYWYTDSSLDDSAYFAKVFRKSADKIMAGAAQQSVTLGKRSFPWRGLVAGVGAAAFILVAGVLVTRAQNRNS